MKRTLEQALALASPRIVPRPTTLLSTLIHLSVVVLWLLLFARAFFLQGVVAWSTGIAYVVYDTLLLAFVTVKTLPLMRPLTPLDPASDQRSLPSMGVIVASHNEAAVLPVTLAALLRQVARPRADRDCRRRLDRRHRRAADRALWPDRRAGRRTERTEHASPEPLLAARAARRQGAGAERRHYGDDHGHRDDRRRRHAARRRRHLRDAGRLRERAETRGGGGHPRAGLRQKRFGPGVPVVPDLRVHAQLHRALCVDARRQPAADLRRICLVPRAMRSSRWAASTRSAWWRTTS